MLKDYIIIFLLISYFFIFIIWIIWFHKSLKNCQNKKNKYLINTSGFVVLTYFISFLVLKILS